MSTSSSLSAPLAPPSSDHCLHRIHEGSPAKIRTPQRIFDLANREGTVVWKAQQVTEQENLQVGEVYITHRKVIDDKDCALALAKIGVSEAVLVSEGLILFAEEADEIFRSLSGIAEYREDVKTIMTGIQDVPGLQRQGSFCRFAHALYYGCQQHGELYEAIKRSGMKLFWQVLEDFATSSPENGGLQWMLSREEDEEMIPLSAWNHMFFLVQERHQKSHPFNLIGGNLELAETSLEVMKFLASDTKQDTYKEVSYLIRAALPVIEKKISQKKVSALKEKQRNALIKDVVRARMPRRKLWGKT